MNKLFLIAVLFTIGQSLAMAQGAGAFNPVSPTGIPYSIIITGVSLNGGALPDSTTIAVFDDTLCVGVVGYVDSGNLQLVAWQGDPTQSLPGFTQGHSMSFKARFLVGTTYFVEAAAPTFAAGNGTFGFGTFSVLSLQVTSIITGIAPSIQQEKISVFPNPFTDFIKINMGEKVCRMIEFFDLSGKVLYQKNLQGNPSEIIIPAGTIFTEKNENGLVIVKCHCNNELIIRKLLYQGRP